MRARARARVRIPTPFGGTRVGREWRGGFLFSSRLFSISPPSESERASEGDGVGKCRGGGLFSLYLSGFSVCLFRSGGGGSSWSRSGAR